MTQNGNSISETMTAREGEGHGKKKLQMTAELNIYILTHAK
jgi:hypothetical protein